MTVTTDARAAALRRLQNVNLAPKSKVPQVRADRFAPVPLSWAQRRIWFVEQLDGRSGAAYHLGLGLRLRGQLDTRALQRTLDTIVERHESLRTCIKRVDGEPFQYVRADSAFPLKKVDLSNVPAKDRSRVLRDVLSDGMEEAFDLENGPLARGQLILTDKDEYFLALYLHHIVTDGWSTRLLMREIETLYNAFVADKCNPLPPLEVQYRDYTAWQSESSNGLDLKRQEDFWRSNLAGSTGLLDLPSDLPRGVDASYASASVSVDLPDTLTYRLRELNRLKRVTPFMASLAAWSLVLARCSGQAEVVIGTPVANRQRPEFDGIVGFFANTLALRVKIDDDPSVRELLERVRSIVLDAASNQDLPFDRVVDVVKPPRSLGRNPIFQVSMALDNTPGTRTVSLSNLDVEVAEIPRYHSPFELNLSLADDGNRIAGTLDFATDLFSRATAEEYARRFISVLGTLLDNEDERVSSLPLLNGAERRSVHELLNPAGESHDLSAPIQALFEAHVTSAPNAIALSFEGQRLTYLELNERANQLAHRLIALGIRPDDRVALHMARGLSLVVGILGILKSGGAYVPFDPTYPEERLLAMYADCRPVAVVRGEDPSVLPDGNGVATICLDQTGILQGAQDSPGNLQNPDPETLGLSCKNLAYIIYTSGSTGRPKGVMIEHRQVTRLFTATNEWFKFSSTDVWSLFHSYAFDFSVWEIWGALFYGGRLVLVPSLVARSPKEFYSLICREGVTVLNQTPSAFRQLIAAQAESDEVHRLRAIIFGGEALELHILEPWIGRNDPERTHLVNMYGITETTVHVTHRRIKKSDIASRLGSYIGRPIPDLRLYILDPDGRPVPPLVTGEIFVGGAGLARGYLNRPDLTAERFKTFPAERWPHERLYKTGDLARLLPNGEVEYLGRNDFQVKIRGFRIELGEIEECIRKYADVHEAVVVARAVAGGEKSLIAYVIPLASNRLVVTDLRRFVANKLPAHMVPSAFVEIEAFPLTRNGKLDQNALPLPDLASFASRDYIQPLGEIESIIATAWQDLLGIAQVGRDDNFFELGGNSIIAVRATADLSKKLGKEIALRDLFSAPTVKEFALKADQRGARTFHPNLAPVRTNGVHPPLFLIHPIEGEVGYARTIAEMLDPQIPVYGIAATGLLDGETPLKTISEINELYLSIVREVQPSGPYRLAGWSAGGTIAYSLAERLRADGEDVSFLGLIDTLADYNLLPVAPTLHVNNINGIDEKAAKRFEAVRHAIFGAVAAYKPRRIDVPVHLFTANDPSRLDNKLGWELVLDSLLITVPVGGSHYTIVEDPHVGVLCSTLNRCLLKV